jgi:hypothetical protein
LRLFDEIPIKMAQRTEWFQSRTVKRIPTIRFTGSSTESDWKDRKSWPYHPCKQHVSLEILFIKHNQSCIHEVWDDWNIALRSSKNRRNWRRQMISWIYWDKPFSFVRRTKAITSASTRLEQWSINNTEPVSTKTPKVRSSAKFGQKAVLVSSRMS